jgi:hypothetical protein
MSTMDEIFSRKCSGCGGLLDDASRFCSQCGQPNGVAKVEPEHHRVIIIVLAVCFGIGFLYFILSRSSSNRVILNTPGTTSVPSANSIVTSIAESTNQLTRAKVERAVSQLTSNLRVDGAISVEGIQELPQENSARADLRFTNFRYKADMAGTPLSSNRQAPEKPQINDPNFYDKMYRYGTQQVYTKTYSGQGFAVLKHYNDGRWVLKEVRWEFNGWVGDVDINR